MLSLYEEGNNKRKVAFCENCKTSQKSTACNVQWRLRMCIENQEEGNTKVTLNIYSQ